MTKKIIITGGVTSGVGKGVITASISNLLKKYGLKVQPVKFDGFLNKSFGDLVGYHKKQEIIFSGEEVFVLEDGTEADSDLGVYERFINQNLKGENNIVNGSCLEEMLSEKMVHRGELIKIRPHLMRIYMKRIESLSQDSDVIILEIGGTVGDDENSFFLALLGARCAQDKNYISLHLSYIPQDISREEISQERGMVGGKNLLKPVKNGILELAKYNLFPEFVLLRGREIKIGELERIAEATTLDMERIEVIPEVDDIYTLPKILEQGRVFKRLLNRLKLKRRELCKDHIDKYLQDRVEVSKDVKILVAGETESWDSFISLNEALKHSATSLGYRARVKWYKESDSIENYNNYDGIIITEGLERINEKMKLARICFKIKKPLLAISAGAQIVLATLEGEQDANKLERILLEGGMYFVKTKLFKGVRDSQIDNNSALYRIIKNGGEIGRHRNDIEVDYMQIRNVRVNATYKNFVDAFEYLRDNCWIFGTIAHPEYISRPGNPNKIISAFLERCIQKW